MIEMDDAIRIVLENTQAIDVATLSLMDSLGRTLAEDVRSDINMPPFDKAAMDGYALVGADISEATKENPAILQVIEEIPAGTIPKKKVSAGNASQIMTGAPIPEGADTVVMVEDTLAEDGKVQVLEVTPTGNNIAWLGEDVKVEQIVLQAGSRIRAPEVGILAAVGAMEIPVYRRPIVGIVATGSEIVEPHLRPDAGQIRNSNGYSMSAGGLQAGAETRYLGIVEDDESALRNVISKGLDTCDVLMLSGGVSAGVYDLVQGAMRDCGVEVHFDRILMKPGKPLTFGTRGKKLVFGLPGNPVSTVVGLELLVRPALRKMQNIPNLHHPQVRANLKSEFRQTPGRKQFVPAYSEETEPGWQTSWVGHHGSADLFSLSRANSLFIVGAELDKVDAGEEVDVVLLQEW